MDRDPRPEHIEELGKIALTGEEFLNRPEEERIELMEYNESIQEIYTAMEGAESAKGWRVIFERAPAETLPFIIYCVYVAGQGLGSTFMLTQYDGNVLPFVVLILAGMVLPLLIQPIGRYSTAFMWIHEMIGRKISKVRS